MEPVVLVTAVVLALSAFCLGCVALLLHWIRRHDDPRTVHIEADLADLADRFNRHVKRQAARSSREAQDKARGENGAEAGSQDVVSADFSPEARFRRKYGQ